MVISCNCAVGCMCCFPVMLLLTSFVGNAQP
uniref:Uncharacterized protein n=1 Tax=Anguilla anguilla TaxID=7936 RepID=A0A0E9VBS1_ANGAN